jgi:linoleoyl-CoA desaturase
MKLSLPNGFTTSNAPDPTGPAIERGRKRDEERPTRRTETGGWARASA